MSLYDTGGFIDRALDLGDTSRYGDIESGLTLTRTESPGTVVSFSSTERTQDAVFACDVYFPFIPEEGTLFEMGGGAIGHTVGFSSDSSTLIFSAGDGANPPNLAIAARLELTDFPRDGKIHTVVWDIRINPGRIRVWIDNELKGTADTSGGAALEGNSWAGADDGGYLQPDTIGSTAGVAGDIGGGKVWPTKSRTNQSNLRYYQNQLVTATVGNRKNSGIWNLDAVYLNEFPLLTLTAGGVTVVWDGVSDLILDSTEEYTVSVKRDFIALVKMWGGGGAAGFIYTGDITSTSREGPGGGGGYSSAQIQFRRGEYIFQIGEGGARVPSAGTGATYLAGGVQASSGGAQGGGYSGIFKTSVSQANALLIAGGGGGGSDTAFSAYGGAGGGVSGLPGESNDLQAGQEGTQSAGGAGSAYNNATAGSALTGGLGQSNTESLGGGGGGYYGGGGGNVGGGGGGSSYISGDPDVSSGTTSAGLSSTPGNSSDTDRGTAGTGGVSGSTSGSDGKILLRLL